VKGRSIGDGEVFMEAFTLLMRVLSTVLIRLVFYIFYRVTVLSILSLRPRCCKLPPCASFARSVRLLCCESAPHRRILAIFILNLDTSCWALGNLASNLVRVPSNSAVLVVDIATIVFGSRSGIVHSRSSQMLVLW
jgi:hypothetical protein